MDNFIVILFKCSFFMSIITIIYALSLLLISKHYTAKWCYHIWLIIVVGWLIPIRPTFNISFLPLQNFKSLEIPKKIIAVNTYADNVVFNQVISEKTKGISLLTCFFIIWLVGVLIIFSYHVLRHMYFMKVIRHWSIDFSDKSYIELFNKIKQEQIIKEEIKIIKPAKIVFYTARDYDYYIQHLFDDFTVKVDGQCQIGKRNMPWLEAASEVDDIRILRVGHPERKKKVDFTNKISAWIQS